MSSSLPMSSARNRSTRYPFSCSNWSLRLSVSAIRDPVRVPPRDPNLRLQDVVEAIDRIFDYTASHTLESFAADRLTVDAVVRNLRSSARPHVM